MKRAESADETPGHSGSALATELRRRFSFTRSEANVALLIADGLPYAEVAGRLGISYHTVHTHVNAIHAKARVSSNVRLVALIRSIEKGWAQAR
jgi:DNA-binding CsgD family transcriptional regulator